MSKLTLRLLTDEEVAECDAMWDRRAWYDSLTCMLEEQCVDDHGTHAWWLEVDPDDGISFYCQRCPADVAYIHPDGMDLLTGEFEVFPGYVLSLQTGGVLLNGKETYGLFIFGWRGRVTARLTVEKYTSMDFIGEEYDAWIELEAA